MSKEKVLPGCKVKLSTSLERDLRNYCSVMEMAKSKVFTLALKQYLAPYKVDPGFPMQAFLLNGASEYEKKVAENEGREIKITEKPCTVLGKKFIYGNPYYRIIADKQLKSVPENLVRIISKPERTSGE